MVKRYLTSALIAAALLASGAAFAQQGGAPGPMPISQADQTAAAQLVADIKAAVAMLGANPTAQQVQDTMDAVITMSAAPPNIAILATSVLAANPAAAGIPPSAAAAVQAAAATVAKTVETAAAASGNATVIAQAQAAQAVPLSTLNNLAQTSSSVAANSVQFSSAGLASAGTLTLTTTNTGSTATVAAYVR